MIQSIQYKGLKRYFSTGDSSKLKQDHVKRIRLILTRLHAAGSVSDMRYPGSGLHQLTGNKRGYHAVTVSGNWRIIFEFKDGHVYDVDYVDYH